MTFMRTPKLDNAEKNGIRKNDIDQNAVQQNAMAFCRWAFVKETIMRMKFSRTIL
jgi:hypothetical protein